MSIPEPNPIDGAPAYFRRLWNPYMFDGADAIVYPAERLMIYGVGCQSPYPEDRRIERAAWRQDRSFYGWHYSRLSPEGEPGSVRLEDVVPITAEEFFAARDAGWPQEFPQVRS